MEISTWLDPAIGCGWLALAVTLARTRGVAANVARWLYLATAFCVLRAFDFLLVRTGVVDVPELVVALDVVVLATLLALVVGTGTLRRSLQRQHREAEHAQTEYGRALLDYTQLVRHRIANPLTAIIVGIQTLIDLDLTPKVRAQILQAVLDGARQLEVVALHPERVSTEEDKLRPRPAPLDDPRAEQKLKHEAGDVEADFRDVNRRLIDVLPDGHDQSVTFVCECSARECAVPVTMTLNDYYAVHGDGAQFVVAPEHDLPAVEDVVHREDGLVGGSQARRAGSQGARAGLTRRLCPAMSGAVDAHDGGRQDRSINSTW